MPRHGPHTTPRMTDAHREAMFASGRCPYCTSDAIASEAQSAKLRSGVRYVVAKYVCQACGAEGTFRHKVGETTREVGGR